MFSSQKSELDIRRPGTRGGAETKPKTKPTAAPKFSGVKLTQMYAD
jgi:hypothetical protein